MDNFDEINVLLSAANQAILQDRAAEAKAPLAAAYPLLVARVAARSSLSVVVSMNAAYMSLLAGDPDQARKYIQLLVEETGAYLEQLGKLFAKQVEAEDREAARHTQIASYTYAVTFIPFVKGARLANLLSGDPTVSTSPEVAAIGKAQNLRRKFDDLQWELWGYPPDSEHRARYWSADALLRWGNAVMDNSPNGEDVQMSQELAIAIQELIRGFPEDQLQADLWNLWSRIYFAYGESQLDDALHASEESVRILKQLGGDGNRQRAARDLSAMGAIGIEHADYLKSRGKQHEAASLRAKAERQLIEARDTLLDMKDYQGFIAAVVNLEALYSKQERWDDADKAFHQAWDEVEKTGDQRVYLAPQIAGNYGSSLFDRGKIQEAEKWLREALKDIEAVRSRDPAVFQVVKGTLGRLLATSERAGEGYKHLRDAKDELESYRTSFVAERTNSELLKTYRWVYEALIDCCVTLGANAPERRIEAYEIAELTKWRTFTVLLRYQPLGLLDEQVDPRVTQEAALLRQAMVALGRPADSAIDAPKVMAQLETLWSEMAADHPQYVAFRRQQTTTFKETQALLDDQVPCLIEYYLGDQYKTAVVFVVNRNNQAPEAIRLPIKPDEIVSRVQQLRECDDRQPEARFRELSQQLYDDLIAPAIGAVPEGAGICVVPYGPLHNLAFAALFDGQRYLIERNALVTAPTASALRWWVEKNPHRNDSCLIFTATSKVYSDEKRQIDLVQFEELARKRLGPLFGKHNLISGADATKAALVQQFAAADDWAVFHLACHGEFGEQPPAHESEVNEGLAARLLMAGAPAPHKDLYAQEIFGGIRTRASLVTLSACESAMADSSTNDELAGLAHSFLLAGAASVLATLSYVRQDPGVPITERFYRLWMGKADGPAIGKIEALQQAQIDVLRKRTWFFGWKPVSHPHQWSAFALYGDWK